MITKSNLSTGSVYGGTDELTQLLTISLTAAQVLAVGTPICRDITKLPGGMLPADASPSVLFFSARQTDTGVLATSANAGDVIGVFTGVGEQNIALTNTTAVTKNFVIPVRRVGLARVLAGAVAAGTAVTIGSKLIITSSNVFATVGTRAIGNSIGVVTAYAVNTTIALATAAGSVAVTPASMAGITTSTVLTIDTGTVQELVTPSAVTATTFTATFANAHPVTTQVKGILSTSGASVIAVPGSGSTSLAVFADVNSLA